MSFLFRIPDINIFKGSERLELKVVNFLITLHRGRYRGLIFRNLGR